MKFKNRLAIRRKELNLTQKDLAKELNLSDKTISKWESGYSYPDFTVIPKLAQALNISVNELIGDEEEHLQEKSRKINQDTVYKYKLMFYLSAGLAIFAFLIYLNLRFRFLFIPKSELSNIILLFSIIFSIVIFIFNTLTFRFVYKNQGVKKDYDLLTFKYSKILLHIYSLISWWIVASNFPRIFSIDSIHIESLIKVIFFTLTISFIGFYLIPKIKTLCNIEIPKNRNTKTLKIILIIFINITIISIFVSFIMHYLVLNNLLNVIAFPYRLLLLITYILFIFIFKSYNYKE